MPVRQVIGKRAGFFGEIPKKLVPVCSCQKVFDDLISVFD
jgi:hypothetical protein